MIDPSYVVNSPQDDGNFATAEIAGITPTGYQLIFPGQTEASNKSYKGNSSTRFYKGQRVRVLADSGTYIVEYPIAGPNLYRTVGFQVSRESAGTIKWGYDVIDVSYTDFYSSGVDIRTTNPIDLTDVYRIEFSIFLSTFYDTRGLYIGVVKEKLDGGASPPWENYFAAYDVLTSAGIWHRYIDVSKLKGEYYICCHAYAQTYTIKSINLI